MSTEATITRVCLVDNHSAMLAKIIQLLPAEFEIIAALPDGSGLTAALERYSPAIVLLDITLPGESGLELATRLRLEGHPCKVVILSVHDDPDYVRAALAAGADGYVVKSQLAVDLVPALEAVLAGRKFVSPDRLPPRFM